MAIWVIGKDSSVARVQLSKRWQYKGKTEVGNKSKEVVHVDPTAQLLRFGLRCVSCVFSISGVPPAVNHLSVGIVCLACVSGCGRKESPNGDYCLLSTTTLWHMTT